MLVYFIVLFVIGWSINILTYRLIKKNNFRIEKTSYGMGYTVKELFQLYGQSNSFQTSKQITILIKLTRWSKILFWIYTSIFILLWILITVKK